MNSEILKAKERLDAGKLVGMPTETVYGLAARIDLLKAIEQIFIVKERPFFDPLIVHVSSIEQARTLTTQWSKAAEVLATRFWPGPLTLVLPRSKKVSEMITSGLDTVGIRMPGHPMALELLKTVGVPLAAPSANKFGKTSPTSAAHVRLEFKNDDVSVLEGGDCQIGIESTVLLLKEKDGKAIFSILRKGHVVRSEIEEALKKAELPFEYHEAVSKKESPGHMKHHYMPDIPLVLIKKPLSEEEIIQATQKALEQMPDVVEEVKIKKPKGKIQKITELKLSDDPTLACRELYAQMRMVATSGADLLFFQVKATHQGERWEGIFDRLNKAASLILT